MFYDFCLYIKESYKRPRSLVTDSPCTHAVHNGLALSQFLYRQSYTFVCFYIIVIILVVNHFNFVIIITVFGNTIVMTVLVVVNFTNDAVNVINFTVIIFLL